MDTPKSEICDIILKGNGVFEMGKMIDREVKLAYVEQIMLKKMTPPQVAKELDLNAGTVYDWVKKYKQDPANFMPGSGNQKPDDEEMRKLQAENKRLQDEITFLKNVTAYFAKDHRKNTP